MVSKKLLCIGAQKTPIQKTYEINIGQDSINIDFLGTNRQFDWLEISLVFIKATNTQQFTTATTSNGLQNI